MTTNRPLPIWIALLIYALVLLAQPIAPQPAALIVPLTADQQLRGETPTLNALRWAGDSLPALLARRGDDGGWYPSATARILAWADAPLVWLGRRLPGSDPLWLGGLLGGLGLSLIGGVLSTWLLRRGWNKISVICTTLLIAGLGAAVGLLLTGGFSTPGWFTPADSLPLQLHLLLPPLILLLAAVLVLAGAKMPGWAGLILAIFLTGQVGLSAAHLALARPDSAPEQTMLAALPADSQPLWVTLPSAGDAAAVTARLIRLANRPLAVWREGDSPPFVATAAGEIRLFERGRRIDDPLPPTARALNRQAFFISEQWLDGGRLSAYRFVPELLPAAPVNVPFAGGITLVDFAVAPADNRLAVRLTWQINQPDNADPLVAFVQLIAPDGNPAAQQDRLLFNPARPDQTPVGTGETAAQGYALSLPANLPPGQYPLVVGLYNAVTVARLPRADASPDDFLYLTTITLP